MGFLGSILRFFGLGFLGDLVDSIGPDKAIKDSVVDYAKNKATDYAKGKTQGIVTKKISGSKKSIKYQIKETSIGI